MHTDFEKALDKMNHDLLITKLGNYVTNSLLTSIKSGHKFNLEFKLLFIIIIF